MKSVIPLIPQYFIHDEQCITFYPLFYYYFYNNDEFYQYVVFISPCCGCSTGLDFVLRAAIKSSSVVTATALD